MLESPHPESVFRAPDGRIVELKVHRCRWADEYPENSLAAILASYRARVRRAEIDLNLLADADFLVTHDLTLDEATTGTGRVDRITRREAERLRFRWRGRVTDHRPPLLSEVVAAVRAEPYPTLLELDLKDLHPLPWPRVEELARTVAPVRDRVIFGSCADWNLRRLLHVDPTLPVGFNPMAYLDWSPDGPDEENEGLAPGAYGYFDRHPLARRRYGPAADYLRDRLGGILRLVPGARELHVRLACFERMLDDGFADVVSFCHARGLLVDVWTLDAGPPGWRERLARAVAAGVDVVTTNTPRALAAAGAAVPHEEARDGGLT